MDPTFLLRKGTLNVGIDKRESGVAADVFASTDCPLSAGSKPPDAITFLVFSFKKAAKLIKNRRKIKIKRETDENDELNIVHNKAILI
jgi:hypothetical protein